MYSHFRKEMFTLNSKIKPPCIYVYNLNVCLRSQSGTRSILLVNHLGHHQMIVDYGILSCALKTP